MDAILDGKNYQTERLNNAQIIKDEYVQITKEENVEIIKDEYIQVIRDEYVQIIRYEYAQIIRDENVLIKKTISLLRILFYIVPFEPHLQL